jgi:hypothetical protein
MDLPEPGRRNRASAHRHAIHAWEDFQVLCRKLENKPVELESISHHLRHVVYRLGIETEFYVPRSDAEEVLHG